jgi:hypothetical protein
VQRFAGTDPQQTRVATVAHFQSLSSLADGSIAAQLSSQGFQVSGDSVGTLVNELCQDLHGSRNSNPIQDIQFLLPNASLPSLPALNGVVSQVTQTCTPLNSFQADGLTWSWVGEGSINVRWAASYTGIQYDLWVSNDGQWEQLESGTYQTSAQVNNLFNGHFYQFAVRAVANGSGSPWWYMSPCLTCAE